MKTLRAWITIALVTAGAALTACPGPSPTVETDGALAGAWSPYSATIYYDAGGGGAFQGGSYSLTLSDSGTWSYGSSSGSWSVAPISSDDWTSWGIESYGPTRKLVLEGWNGGTASGPIEEETDGTVNSLWAIYPYQSDQGPATVWLRFGH